MISAIQLRQLLNYVPLKYIILFRKYCNTHLMRSEDKLHENVIKIYTTLKLALL
jgi:hypothetical protein